MRRGEILPKKDKTRQATMKMPRDRLEGSPEGLDYDGIFTYIGSVENCHAFPPLTRVDLVDIIHGNAITQRISAGDEIARAKGLSAATRKELTEFIEARLQALAYLATSCIRATDADSGNIDKRSGISLANYPGGPIVSDASGWLWHHQMPTETTPITEP